jgi:hypothetical protein
MRGARNASGIRVEGAVAYVSLSQGQEAMIDVVDIPLVEGRPWHAVWNPHQRLYYAAGVRRKVYDKPGPTRVYMHRLIMGEPEGMEVDHLHHNTLDNRRSELRVRTRQANAQNRSTDARSKTGVRGVSVHTDGQGRRYYCAKVAVVQYFPLTDEGLAQASARVELLRARLSNDGEW